MLRKRPRIRGFSYTGFHRYSLTICTHLRAPVLTHGNIVNPVLSTIRQWAAACDFAIIAYCFMPDHVHLIMAATTEAADLKKFVTRWKQRTGYDYRQQHGAYLWQPSYFDHVLRDDEATDRAVRYVLENPVRKGLARKYDEPV